MNHLIIGYGYCGFYLAKELIAQQQTVTTLSRCLNESLRLPQVRHLLQDASTPIPKVETDCVLYYLIPPLAEGRQDKLLRQFLTVNAIKPSKVLYFGSSGVYGDQQGAWVTEQTPCLVTQARQYRRLDAEAQWQAFCDTQGIACVILRIAGIYGPERLPVDAALKQSALITPEEAPVVNHIYVRDLVKIAAALAMTSDSHGIFNVADGAPDAMGSLQRQLALALNCAPASYQGFAQIWAEASPMKREFMQASKRLDITALQQTLPSPFVFTSKETAILESLS